MNTYEWYSISFSTQYYRLASRWSVNKVKICFIHLTTLRKYCTYHIHYSEDIWFHMVTSMIFNHLTVCNHKCLHPSLFADRAPRNLSDSHMILFPFLPPMLLLFEKAEGIWKSKKQSKCFQPWFEAYGCKACRQSSSNQESQHRLEGISGCHLPDQAGSTPKWHQEVDGPAQKSSEYPHRLIKHASRS